MLWVNHDRPADQLHVQFQKDRLIVATEWFAENATIDLALDGGPVAITVFRYYTAPLWPLTEELVNRYHLAEWLDDLKIVYNAFFSKTAKLQTMRVET